MSRHSDLQRVLNGGIVAIIRASSGEQLVNVAQALYDGGIDVIEVTFTTPGVIEVISAVIASRKDKRDPFDCDRLIRGRQRGSVDAFARADRLTVCISAEPDRLKPRRRRQWPNRKPADLRSRRKRKLDRPFSVQRSILFLSDEVIVKPDTDAALA